MRYVGPRLRWAWLRRRRLALFVAFVVAISIMFYVASFADDDTLVAHIDHRTRPPPPPAPELESSSLSDLAAPSSLVPVEGTVPVRLPSSQQQLSVTKVVDDRYALVFPEGRQQFPEYRYPDPVIDSGTFAKDPMFEETRNKHQKKKGDSGDGGDKTPKQQGIADTEATRNYFKNIFVILMMSPSRYHLAELVRQHYAPYFTHMYFCGPRDSIVDGIFIKGYDIVYGNEQYRAVRNIIREVMHNTSSTSPTSPPPYEGFLYISDDLLLQPWSIAGRNYDKLIPWSTGMGIANLYSGRGVNAVPAMSVQSKYRLEWPYFKKNRKKMLAALSEGGEPMQRALNLAFNHTHPLTMKWSKFKGGGAAAEGAIPPVMFYTIVDTYYVPWRLAHRYAQICDLMAKHWLFGECGIATALQLLTPIHETLRVSFYWSSLSAADCHRMFWTPEIDGFHRCRHDHLFAHWMYSTDEQRRIDAQDQQDHHEKQPSASSSAAVMPKSDEEIESSGPHVKALESLVFGDEGRRTFQSNATLKKMVYELSGLLLWRPQSVG